MSPRRSTPVQAPLPPFKGELDLAVQARKEEELRRVEHNRALARERSRRYRYNKKHRG